MLIRKASVLIFAVIISISLFSFDVNAEDISELEKSVGSLIDSLSPQVQEDLKTIGADSTDLKDLSQISFESIVALINEKLSENSSVVLSSGCVVVAVLLLNALFDSYTDLLKRSSIKEILSVASTLCITTTLVIPVINLINSCIKTITEASDFMLLYIPVMVAVLTFSGQLVTGASYYSMMVLVCQGVSQLSTKFIAPLLNVYLAFCVSSSITDRVNLKGICDMFSKIIKWLIAFVMTIFSALLTIKGMITTAYDSVTTRAVRFTMSSFIPIVGAALSESYKTIQASINLLRTGAGVFVILAILVVFLPSILKCMMWMLSLNLCKTVGQIVGVTSPVTMLNCVSTVVSTVFSITMCIMSVFVISTALLIMLGGGGV